MYNSNVLIHCYSDGFEKNFNLKDFSMKKEVSKYEPLFQEIKKSLPPSFNKGALSSEIKRIVAKDTSGKATMESKKAGINRLVAKRLNEVKYGTHGGTWQHWKSIGARKLYTFEKYLDGLDCAHGLVSENRYFSNLSAVYLLGLTNQRPLKHYVCLERHSSPATSFVYDEELAKILFRKNAKVSKRYIQYKETEIYFIEKQCLGMMGVASIPVKRKDKKLFFTKCTDLERTFMDSVVSPQYSGGIRTVISFFRDTNLNLRDLKNIYQKLNPIYPYWQSIGYLLDVMKQEEKSEEWYEYFKNFALKKFFVSKGYRSNWDFNKKWKIYHPESMT